MLGTSIIVLSCFDGIATGPLALQQLFGPLRKIIAWEIDPEAISVSRRHFPDIIHRGDFLDDDPQDVAQTVHDFNHDGRAVVVWLGAPPCPDFSPIKGDEAPGSKGQEGQKFIKFCTFAREVESQLHPIRVGYLVENVILQDRAEIHYFSQALDCQAIVMDAADYGLVSRPRLWWTRVPWHNVTKHPFTNHPVRWSQHQKLHRLHVGEPHQDPKSIHQSVLNKQKVIPCFTTPAPSEEGRPAPKKFKGRIDPETKSRWLSDQRAFAPWQYSPEALMHSEDGLMHVPTPEVKEQLHMLPKGYTEAPGVAERSRHRLLANGWHTGVARLLLYLVVTSLQQAQVAALLNVPRLTTLQWVVQQLSGWTPHVGPGGWKPYPCSIAPSDTMWQHWQASQHPTHPLQQPPRLPPGILQAIQLQQRWRHDLDRIRLQVVQEISEWVGMASDETQSWWSDLPEHIRNVYFDKKHDQVTQIPILLKLLELTGFPGLTDLQDDLVNGFEVLGELHAGCGWNPRMDDKYSFPIDRDAFRRINQSYVKEKLRKNHVDQHWQVMLDELLEERDLGRISGPFAAPSWWPCQTQTLPGVVPTELPTQDIAVAFCFSVSQSDKTRRCEDLRRSGHNATVKVSDIPHHDSLDTYIQVAHQYSLDHKRTMAWTQDLAGPYRQFPVRHPDDCYVALTTPQGVYLFRHHALAFGAVASVWGFNRRGDALAFLAQRALFCTVGHYVDDFIGLEDEDVQSSFDSFTSMFRVLGLRMKEQKAAPPAKEQKILGVMVKLHQEKAEVYPHPPRVEKLLRTLHGILRTNRLTQEEAHTIAGKLMFLTTSLFGNLGRSALVPIYSRARGLQDINGAEVLNSGLRGGITTLISILEEIKPRIIPFDPDAPCTCIYTDAFFQMGEQIFKPHTDFVAQWSPSKACGYVNGWGVVIRLGNMVVFSYGRVPPRIIQRFCSRKAYIYFLEIVTCPDLLQGPSPQTSGELHRQSAGQARPVERFWQR